jgi:hypothetical protein
VRFASPGAKSSSLQGPGAVEELVGQLVAADRLSIFLMEDGWPIAARYRGAGGDPLQLRFGRRDLPHPRLASYVLMFELVNRAAVAANGSWGRFLRLYDAEMKRFDRDPIGKIVDRRLARRAGPLLSPIAAAAATGKDIVVVDTGMQGTLALYVARWLEVQLAIRPRSVDVQLLAVYPWLSTLFGGRHVTTDCRVVAALEKGSRVKGRVRAVEHPASSRATGLGAAPAGRSRSSAADPRGHSGIGSRIRS